VLDTPTLTKALVGAEAANSVATIKYAAPSADEKKIEGIIADEVGRIEARLSVMLAHIEGNYESQVANLKLKVAAIKWLWPLAIVLTLMVLGLGVELGRILK